MADYAYDPDVCFDPDHPENIVRNAPIELYDATDLGGTTLLSLKDTFGMPLPNPLPSNDYGVIQKRIASVPQMLWKSGDFSGFFSSYKGLRDEALAAKAAAEQSRTLAEAAGLDAAAAAEAQMEAAATAATSAATSATTALAEAAAAKTAALAAKAAAEDAAAVTAGGGFAVDPSNSNVLLITTLDDGTVAVDPTNPNVLLITT